MSRYWTREQWRKLYRRESLTSRLQPVLARGLRDYLLRDAEDDGTLVRGQADPLGALADALGTHPEERAQVLGYLKIWVQDGYLSVADGRAWVTNLAEAQERRDDSDTEEPSEEPTGETPPPEETPTERRRRLARERQQRRRGVKPARRDAGNVTERDRGANSRVTTRRDRSVTERDERDPLPPHTPPTPSERKTESEKATATARDGVTRDRATGQRDTDSVTPRDREAPEQQQGGKIPCPEQIELSKQDRAKLHLAVGMTDAFVDRAGPILLLKLSSGSERPYASWKNSLITALTGTWNNRAKRVEILGEGEPQADAAGPPPVSEEQTRAAARDFAVQKARQAARQIARMPEGEREGELRRLEALSPEEAAMVRHELQREAS